jgi:CRISPR-associated protein Cmr1
MLNKISSRYQLDSSKITNTGEGGNYPWIKKIEIGKEYQSWEDLVKKIGQASHNHRDPSLGNASPRMASPIYVSVIKIGGKYHPIITTLNSYFPHDGYPSWNFNQQQEQDFKQEILL